MFPKPGWVEHLALDIWSSQAGVAPEALTKANLRAADLPAIGITNQRETTVVWDRTTGQPICGTRILSDLDQPASWSPTGSLRMRFPVAAKMALHSAGATGGTAVSPTPEGGASLATMCT